MSFAPLIDWLTHTPMNTLIMNYRWSWPICESLHFCGLALMTGTVGTFDLRLLGLGKGVAPATFHKSLRFGVVGFVISAITGSMFLFGQPDQYFYNGSFKLKVLALLLLGTNVIAFYTLESRRVLALGPNDDAPLRAKVFAAISLFLLVAIMLFGRMLTFFRPLYIPS
jgi:hypothetical protein